MNIKNKKKRFRFQKGNYIRDSFHFFHMIHQLISQKNKTLKERDIIRISLISHIVVCCLFGTLCFKYLQLNKWTITGNLANHFSNPGGNKEIIAFLQQNGYSFEECLETSVKYHKYELTNWLNENYKCKPVSSKMH